jgi:excisionase family DNA binding protein
MYKRKDDGKESVKLLLTMEEAANALSVGRTVVYELVSHRKLNSVKIGRCRRIPLSALQEFISREIA